MEGEESVLSCRVQYRDLYIGQVGVAGVQVPHAGMEQERPEQLVRDCSQPQTRDSLQPPEGQHLHRY